MAKKSKVRFVCSECGHESPKWLGQCPTCTSWHTLEETELAEETPGGRHIPAASPSSWISSSEKPVITSIRDIPEKAAERFSSGMSELDRLLGGGFMPGSFLLLGGDPGIGKSTLALQIARSCPKLSILYVAGEESPHQIRQRATRIGADHSNLSIYNSTEVSEITQAVLEHKPSLLIVDSIQTVYRKEYSGLPGSVQQIRECATLFQHLAKRENITTILIGHMTKDGEIAGPRLLEHMVDTVLQFEGDPIQMLRILRSSKNRFGPAHEVSVFEMTGAGLEQVDNPSRLFLSDPDDQTSGKAVTCIMEGSRPILLEVQALVTPSTYATPQRMAAGFDQRRLSLLIAVLEKRASISFAGKDIYVSVTGGFKITDPSADAAVGLALVSSLWDVAMENRIAVVGEVGLGGEIRSVPMFLQRLQESERLGFTTLLHGRLHSRSLDHHFEGDKKEKAGIHRIEVRKISDLIRQSIRSQ